MLVWFYFFWKLLGRISFLAFSASGGYPHPLAQEPLLSSKPAMTSLPQVAISRIMTFQPHCSPFREICDYTGLTQIRASLVAQLVKNLLAVQEIWFNPWFGKIPWRRERLPTPVSWSGEFHGLYSPWGCKEIDKRSDFNFHPNNPDSSLYFKVSWLTTSILTGTLIPCFHVSYHIHKFWGLGSSHLCEDEITVPIASIHRELS